MILKIVTNLKKKKFPTLLLKLCIEIVFKTIGAVVVKNTEFKTVRGERVKVFKSGVHKTGVHLDTFLRYYSKKKIKTIYHKINILCITGLLVIPT